MENKEAGIAIDIRAIVHIIRKRIWLIACITAIATAVSYYVSFYVLKPIYETKISVVIIKAQENLEHQQYDYNDINMYQDLIKTYAQIAISRTVAVKASELLQSDNIKAGSLLGQLMVKPQEGTQIMDLMIRDLTPEMARDKLNALTYSFIEEATRIFPNGSVQLIDEAVAPQNPISPNKKMNIAAAFLLGLLGSTVLAFFIELFDNTIKTEADVEKHLGISVLGIVPMKSSK